MPSNTKYPKTIKTEKDIVTTWGWLHTRLTIPAGTKLKIASNLPDGTGYWLPRLPKHEKKNADLRSWFRNYGILIYNDML